MEYIFLFLSKHWSKFHGGKRHIYFMPTSPDYQMYPKKTEAAANLQLLSLNKVIRP